MKKLLSSIFATIIITTGLFAQTIEKLDEKNGFKEFTLGESFTKWQSQLRFDGNWDDGTKAYLYTGTCCNKVFEYYVDKIILRFSSNKLVGIYITTEKFQKEYKISNEFASWRSDDFESIKSSFAYLFGKPTSVDSQKDSGKVIYFWAGKKVVLVSKYDYLGVRDGDRQQINIVDRNFLDSNIKSGF